MAKFNLSVVGVPVVLVVILGACQPSQPSALFGGGGDHHR
mgnify:CR=1 FL=1